VELSVSTSIPACDAAGYLLDSTTWNRAFAERVARAEGIELGEAHWQVIEFLRDYHQRFQLSPPMRVLVKVMAPLLGEPKATSRRLYQLFPEGPARQACKIAGLPKPESCL
jgi:tRNA 2-thiouridine synthesizing protein E